MAVYRREARIDADFERVWSFHSTVGGLQELTPGWMHLDVDRVVGPDGEPDPAVLEQGSQLRLSVRPFGVGPRQRWTSRIVERVRREGRAWFRDDMVDGPFDRWVHTHTFFGDRDGTLLVDTVEYELPIGGLNAVAWPFATVGFEGMFRRRHARTKELLE